MAEGTAKKAAAKPPAPAGRPAFPYDYPEFVRILTRHNRKTGEVTKNPYAQVEGRVAGFADFHREREGTYKISTTFDRDEAGVLVATAFVWSSILGEITATAGAYGKTTVDQSNPYENAETSAVGRALGFFGFGLIGSGGIASAEEVEAALKRQDATGGKPTIPNGTPRLASEPQVNLIHRLMDEAGLSEQDRTALKRTFKRADGKPVEHTPELSLKQASEMIDRLNALSADLKNPPPPAEAAVDDQPPTDEDLNALFGDSA